MFSFEEGRVRPILDKVQFLESLTGTYVVNAIRPYDLKITYYSNGYVSIFSPTEEIFLGNWVKE